MSDAARVSLIIVTCLASYVITSVIRTFKPRFVRMYDNGKKYLGIEYLDLADNLIRHKILRYV